jgi:hypothetical protein
MTASATSSWEMSSTAIATATAETTATWLMTMTSAASASVEIDPYFYG